MTALLNWAVNLGSDFEFATAPLNGLTYSIAGGVLYLAVVLLLREWMRTQEPMQLRLLFAVHNLVLCVGSFLMLVFTLLHVWFMVRVCELSGVCTCDTIALVSRVLSKLVV